MMVSVIERFSQTFLYNFLIEYYVDVSSVAEGGGGIGDLDTNNFLIYFHLLQSLKRLDNIRRRNCSLK